MSADPSGEAILVVDDDPVEAELITRAFRKAGFGNLVRVAAGCDKAKSYLRGDGLHADREKFPLPRLMILDHGMAGETGREVLKWVRQNAALRNLVVIVFSGSDDPDVEQQALRLGANGYHKKPQNWEEYEAILRSLGELWLRGPQRGFGLPPGAPPSMAPGSE